MSDVIRRRYEAWTKDQLLEHAITSHRSTIDDQRHVAAIKRDKERAEALQSVSIKELDAWLGGTIIRDLLLAIHDTKEAGHPLSSPPMENTMRVSHPDSSTDEGAATRRFRKLKGSVRYHLERTTDTIRNNLERDVELSMVRSQVAYSRHHTEGRHNDMRRPGCPDCGAPGAEPDLSSVMGQKSAGL